MPYAFAARRLLALLSCWLAASPSVAAQGEAARPALGRGATEALAARYETSEHWVQKVVVLLSLNGYWHPAGVDMLLLALGDRDPRLRAFGLEALLRCDAALAPRVATTALLDELVTRQLGASNDRYRARVGAALARLVPSAGVEGRSGWARWWRANRDTHQPEPWEPGVQPAPGRGGATSAAAARAFDLYQSGLDLMICIDSTGSMQPTIDALARALGEMADILAGISPKFRLGVVHYKDAGELGDEGAKVVQPLNKNVKAARKKLEKLRAFGGGDLPEAVLGGLDLALHKKRKWRADANKLVIVIGDAPPHAHETSKLVDLARAAYERPGTQGRDSSKPTTGARQETTPFLTSTMGVFLKFRGDMQVRGLQQFEASQRQMRADFQAVADAGGGVFVEVEFEIDSLQPKTSKQKRAEREADGGVVDGATQRIIEHILVLSFGERFRVELRDFVRIFYDYKQAGWIR